MLWKLPEKLSIFVQRAGRAARGAGRTGIAILLVEPSAYSVDSEESAKLASEEKEDNVRGKKKGRKKKPRHPKEYAEEHGRFRGGFDKGRDETDGSADAVPIDQATEGAYTFVQTTTCRRRVLGTVFSNPDSGEE